MLNMDPWFLNNANPAIKTALLNKLKNTVVLRLYPPMNLPCRWPGVPTTILLQTNKVQHRR